MQVWIKYHYKKNPAIHKKPIMDTITSMIIAGSKNDASLGGTSDAKRDGGRPQSAPSHKRLFSSGSDEFADSFDLGDLGMPPSAGDSGGQLMAVDLDQQSMHGDEEESFRDGDEDKGDNQRNEDTADASVKAISTFKTVTGFDVMLDMGKVNFDGHGLHRLFLQHFSDAALLPRLVNNVDTIIKKFNALNVVELSKYIKR